MAALLLPAALAIATASAYADTIYVCWDGSGDYVTIQEGIDAASDGDEVVVCDGVYTGPSNKNLDFHGKAITVRSENGPDNCIIDCQAYGRGFYFHSKETGEAVVEGFTITHGSASSGGGMFIRDASPTVTNCTFRVNSAGDFGGGIYNDDASNPTLIDCTFSGNSAYNGGGIYCWSSSPVQNPSNAPLL